MKKLTCLAVTSMLLAACGTQTPPTPENPQKAYATLGKMMRAIPFPASNIIYDAGGEDPEAKRKQSESGGPSGSRYSNIYAGWEEVENAALTLQETANLLKIPGRMCMNGKPAPTDREDFKKFTEGLAAAGEAALAAAKTKDMDKMLEVGDTVTEACAACHEVYREKDNEADRCTPPAAAAK
jgi:cytochrome c556